MSASQVDLVRRLPRVAVVLGSIAIGFHFACLTLQALDVPSGPWLIGPGETSPAPEPQFVKSPWKFNQPDPIQTVRQGYLHLLHLDHNFSFAGNRAEDPEVRFEVRLTDARGNVQTLHFPDPNANAWVRHRQTILAQALGNDQSFMRPQGGVRIGPGGEPIKRTIWHGERGKEFKLTTFVEHELPAGEIFFSQPSDLSQIMAKAYGRYLCREHDAVRAEVVRHNRNPILPAYMFMEKSQAPQFVFETLSCNFGELRRE
jgi:hypothetical protein